MVNSIASKESHSSIRTQENPSGKTRLDEDCRIGEGVEAESCPRDAKR